MSIYSGIPLATLEARLTEAQDALHALVTGTLTMSLGSADKRLTFNQADIPALRVYIADLQRAIRIASGDTSGARRSPAIATWTR